MTKDSRSKHYRLAKDATKQRLPIVLILFVRLVVQTEQYSKE